MGGLFSWTSASSSLESQVMEGKAISLSEDLTASKRSCMSRLLAWSSNESCNERPRFPDFMRSEKETDDDTNASSAAVAGLLWLSLRGGIMAREEDKLFQPEGFG